MWRVIWFFLGVSRLSITGASPEWCMQRLAKARIAFHFCAKPDDFTAEIWILRRDEARAAQQIRMGGCDCAVLERSGFSAVFDGLWKRPVLAYMAKVSRLLPKKCATWRNEAQRLPKRLQS